MAETYKRAVGEQVSSQGYRQLPSVGNARGPELTTIVYAGVGIVMGILVGTLAADGSIRIPGTLGPQVQAAARITPSADHLAAKTAPTLKVVVQTPVAQAKAMPQVVPQQAAAKTAPISAPVQVQPAQIQAKTSPASVQVAVHAAPAVPVALLTQVARASISAKPSPTRAIPVAHRAAGRHHGSASRRAVYSHRHLTGRRLAAWRRRLARRAALARHRMQIQMPRHAEIADAMPPTGRKFEPVQPVTLSGFTVEGEVTVSSYDSSAGVIDTYEGETFTLGKTLVASNAIRGDGIPSNLHYRCDQSRNCSLILDGQYVSNVRRTR